MKFTKLSLVAALAVSSAFAGGDIAPVEPAPVVEATSPWTFGGDAKLYYGSNSSDGTSIFDQSASYGQAAISADIGYAINSNWKVNMGLTGLMTLGLDDSVVSGVWLYAAADATDTSRFGGTSVGDALWIDTLNITGTMFDGALTTVLGRQALDTPLAFSETWSIAPNTFDAAVALVKPMENLTLVAGYVYDGNGNSPRITTFDGAGQNEHPLFSTSPVYSGTAAAGGFTGNSGYFPVLGINKGAWTVAAVATISDVTAQLWYYDVMDVAQAVWAQADTKIAGFTLGAQYSWIGTDSTLESKTTDYLGANPYEDSSAWAVKAGYDILDNLNVWAAYSNVDDVAAGKTAIAVSNTATMLSGAGWGNAGRHSGQSKLYTEAWWNYGYVGQAGAETVTAAADYTLGNVSLFNDVKLGVQYTNVQGAKAFLGGDNTTDLDEITLLAGANVAGLDVQVAYIGYETEEHIAGTTNNITDRTDEIQLYLTYNF